MEFHFLELPKLRRHNAGPRSGLDRLLSYLGNVGGERAMQEIARTDSRVERMMQLESLFMRDPDLLREYLKDLRDRLDYENSFKWARTDGWEQGRAEGRAEGEAKGRAEGRAEGEAKAAAALAVGTAEAEAMNKRAAAFANYNEAAVLQMLIEVLPQVAEKVAAPMGSIDKLTVVSTEGAAALPRQVNDNVLQTVEMIKNTTGIDLLDILKGHTNGKVLKGETAE